MSILLVISLMHFHREFKWFSMFILLMIFLKYMQRESKCFLMFNFLIISPSMHFGQEYKCFSMFILFMISCMHFHDSCVLREARWVPLDHPVRSHAFYFNSFYREIQCVFAILSQKSMRFTF